jgi:hypothetical protein
MFVIRLPNGNLLVPESAVSDGGQVMSDAYVEIGPDDADYARLAEGALSQEEAEERRRRWRAMSPCDGSSSISWRAMAAVRRRDVGPPELSTSGL